MPGTTPGTAVPDAKALFFAWRGFVRQRESTEQDVLEHPLVREAFAAGYRHGTHAAVALMTEFAGAIEVNRRTADLLEQIVYEREAVVSVGAEEAGA